MFFRKIELKRTISNVNRDAKIELEQLFLLVDMFYLPFEHGLRGMTLLENLQFLLENAHSICQSDKESPSIKSEHEEWIKRHDEIQAIVNQMTKLYRVVIDSPNKVRIILTNGRKF